MTSAWFNYTCSVREADVAKAETCLEEAGAVALSCQDAEDSALIVDELDGAQPLWPVCKVAGLFSSEVSLSNLEARFSAAGLIPLAVSVDELAERQWRDAWRDQFRPLVFAERIGICPSWLEPEVDTEVLIRLDPGMAFGTGNHATTAMCLEWLAQSPDVHGAKVLDYGCGSGILALAAAKLGAREVHALDIDREALAVCRDNALANGLGEDSLVLHQPDTLSEQGFDIIIANILLEPLLGLSEHFASLLAANGSIVLSGVLGNQLGQLLAVYERRFTMTHDVRLGEWALAAGSVAREESRT